MNAGLAIKLVYIASSILFILGLKSLNSPRTARQGMYLAEIGMFLAIVGTLMYKGLSYEWIIIGMFIGSLAGIGIALWTPMTAMPQRTALSHAFGALAATLVGIAEYYSHSTELGAVKFSALDFEVMFGSLTFTGSLMAFGKLQGILPGAPITFKGQNFFNIALFFSIVAMAVYMVIHPEASAVFYIMLSLSTVFGILLVIPIGAADMPVVISLLNSYAGLAGCATGFALNNNVLIIAGALDGASGFILSIIMCKAMNRSITNVLFGAFGKAPESSGAKTTEKRAIVTGYGAEDARVVLENATNVIVVPGYGLAVAQAQHNVKELADLLEKNGANVKYAIHPVAGRMPGHMNVLLAEANVPYDKLVEMEAINPEFETCDVALVVGANDVTNPAAKNDKGSPIYGMPVLEVEKAKTIIFLKRSMNPGFAGIENELFYNPKTMMLFGDAKDTVVKLVNVMKN